MDNVKGIRFWNAGYEVFVPAEVADEETVKLLVTVTTEMQRQEEKRGITIVKREREPDVQTYVYH